MKLSRIADLVLFWAGLAIGTLAFITDQPFIAFAMVVVSILQYRIIILDEVLDRLEKIGSK